MKISLLVLALAFTLAFLPTAQARLDPEPPPSGIVIHLFGQNSVMSNILPTAPSAEAATAPGSPPPAPGLAPSANDQQPSMHDILHQMFVTGDPDAPPGFSHGKTGNNP